jgi:periplasmic divalent cation tolerance protein
MNEFIWLYIPTSSRDEAKNMGRALLEKRLVACVNIFDGMTSMYHWQGDIAEDEEVVMVAKARREQFDAIATLVEELHSYDCPCVVSLKIDAGNAKYLQWLTAETSPDA